jgi:hypothetical protein
MLLFPRSRPVGVNTESTAWAGGVHLGGGSFFAAAHAETKFDQQLIRTSFVLLSLGTHVTPKPLRPL